ncbi:hypothetical protein MYU51_008033 [Penicillium brevicompactum]|uniref:alcohol acetyltransferase n=1 Tax=Penicillium brevicompactum TaxID=5074 RepID=UPI00253FC43F|nr:alcohol acetyltransferase [Penicillium brevicompactum]KAJ5347930.1 alcohol acetyltransferase [Penicillium brevicompactum]
MRHALGFYGALTLTGLYSISDSVNTFDPSNFEHFVPALKHCIAAHPILSAAIQGQATETPSFTRPAYLDLRRHLHVVPAFSPSVSLTPQEDLNLISQVTKEIHDQPFLEVDQHPPWKVCIVPVFNQPGSTGAQKMYIIFAYSHTHGDGRSGLAFHKSFLEGLQVGHDLYDRKYICQSSTSLLPPPLEEVCDLTISWSYFLSNVLPSLMPSSVSRLLGFPSSKVTSAWTGKPMCHEPSNFRTGSQALLVEKSLLGAVLEICREHDVKFTGFFNQLVARVLDTVLPPDIPSRHLIGQIVVDLRPLIPAYAENQMGNSVSALHVSSTGSYPKPKRGGAVPLKHDDMFWAAARRTTMQLGDCASTLADQPIGLLRYLSQFRPWFLAQLGKPRDSSYEISNAVVFDPQPLDSFQTISNTGQMNCDIERMLFSQPANATGSALNFQLVTRKGGDMVITLNWQLGVLDVPDEEIFIRDILRMVQDLMLAICCVCPAACMHCPSPTGPGEK